MLIVTSEEIRIVTYFRISSQYLHKPANVACIPALMKVEHPKSKTITLTLTNCINRS